jgi:hypothetical protein
MPGLMRGLLPRLLSRILPGLLPILLAGSNPALAADTVPAFDIAPSCRAATQVSSIATRDENACKKDEETARAKLEQDWAQYTPAQKNHCVRLSTLGGPASYVELTTCLELSKAAHELPRDMLDSRTVGSRN